MPPRSASLHPRTPATPQQAEALEQACRALWLATLSLMSAAMMCEQPAERQALAARIAHNFRTLAREGDCFGPSCRASFERLAARWARAAEQPRVRREGLH